MLFNTESITTISLDSAGLVALADLSTISHRTCLTGTSSWFDILLLAPGIHTQQDASNLNGGELPTCGALTTGYVFRVENQAMVRYLQGVGRPGCLTTVRVTRPHWILSGQTTIKDEAAFRLEDMESIKTAEPKRRPPIKDRIVTFLEESGKLATLFYVMACSLTIIVIVLLAVIGDWWAIGIIGMLMLARLINTVLIRRRAEQGWKGAPEPGVKGDLLVLLSQDRWVRIKGWVDDLKAVTAGQWLRDMYEIESFFASFATLLVYAAAALAGNSSTIGSLMIAALMLVNVGLLGLTNAFTPGMRMYSRFVYTKGTPKKYDRRLTMANEMIAHSGRNDWAISMGLINAPKPEQQVRITS